MILVNLVVATAAIFFGQVEVTETSKPPYRAQFLGLQADRLVVSSGGSDSAEVQEVPLAELRSIKFASVDEIAPPIELFLRDGSIVRAQGLKTNGNAVEVNLGAGLTLDFQTSFVADIRLQKLTGPQLSQWDSLRQSRMEGDMLALIRSPDTLDKIEGLVLGITDQAVEFEFSGQKIPAPVAKLAGIRFFSSAEGKLTKQRAIVRDINGGVWNASELSAAVSTAGDRADALGMVLLGGMAVTLPLTSIAEIDFSVGSMKYLAELEPLERTSISRFDLGIEVTGSDELFGAQAVSGRRLPLSIEFLGGGTATYRVPPDFTRMAGSVALRPRGSQFTPCLVQILLEKKVVWEKRLATTTQVEPIDLPITADSRVQLKVQAESKIPVGDVVLFRELRFLK